MRRIVIWLASTVTVLVLLFGYHTSTNTEAASPPAATASADSGSSPSPAPSTSSSASSTPSSTPSGTSTTSDAKVTTGSVAQTRWGPVQVSITTAGGKITAVTVPEYPTGNPRDVEINDRALPVLVDETIEAQSADIDMVSGATVTSEGYLESLQAALDEAGI